jgi:hypothetical protein
VGLLPRGTSTTRTAGRVIPNDASALLFDKARPVQEIVRIDYSRLRPPAAEVFCAFSDVLAGWSRVERVIYYD